MTLWMLVAGLLLCLAFGKYRLVLSHISGRAWNRWRHYGLDDARCYKGDLDDEIIHELDRRIFLQSTCKRLAEHGNTFRATSRTGQVTIHTIEPENIKHWSSVQADSFSRFELAKEMASAIWGVGILNADGEHWKKSRALIRPTFKKETVAQLDIFRPHVDRLIQRLPIGTRVDLFPYFQDYVFDTATEFFFGKSALCQDPTHADKDALAFAQAFEAITDAIGRRRHIGMQAIVGHDRWESNKQTLYDFVDKQLARAIGHRDSGVHDDRTILLYETVKENCNLKDLRFETLQIFTPAHESTGSLLSNVMYCLARNPRVFVKTRALVLATSSAEPSWDDLKRITYLRHLINETLRLYPLFVSNTRLCVRDTTLPRGGGPDNTGPVRVLAGDTVSANIWALHRSEVFWGPDSHEFRPERWEQLKQGWEFLPFNGGPHTCPAQILAITEAEYVIFRLLHSFDKIESVDPLPWIEKMSLSVRNHNSVQVTLNRATA